MSTNTTVPDTSPSSLPTTLLPSNTEPRPTTSQTPPITSTTSTAPPTTAPTTSTPPATTATTRPPPQTTADTPTSKVTTIVLTTSQSGTTIFLTSTSTSLPTDTPGTLLPSTAGGSTSAWSSAGPNVSSAPSTGGNGSSSGLNGTGKVVVAVVVPIVGVALIAIALLFLWKKRRRDRENSEMRRKEVEDYGFNPNSPPIAGGATSSNGDEGPYEMQEGSVGYRGWGSTRKTSNMGSTAVPSSVGTAQPLSPVGMVFPEGAYDNGNGYAGVATSPTTATFPIGNAPSEGGMSNAPLINSSPGARPATADSAIVAAMTATQGPIGPDNGIHRGISNASSNYSTATHSDQSDIGIPAGRYEAPYYGVDGGYDDVHNYSGRYDDGHNYQPYPPPVIREVQARRNTQIETPTNTHFPQQGNSGIAQNF